MVVLPLLTALTTGWPIGFASAPYDPLWAQRFPRRAAWMALAGPGANLARVLGAAALLHAGILAGVLAQPESVNFSRLAAAPTGGAWIAAAMLVSVLFSMNLVLFALNMLPIPPLDGSGAIPLLLSRGATERYRTFVQQPMLAWVGMLLVWRIFGALFHPVFLLAVNLLYPGSGYGR
jgi:Zn-dependent protease